MFSFSLLLLIVHTSLSECGEKTGSVVCIPEGEAMSVTRGRLDADVFAAIPAEC